MNQRQKNCVEKAITNTRHAIEGRGFYMPSDHQIAALKALYAETAQRLGKREEVRFKAYLNLLDNANFNKVYDVCADERQLAAIEKAVALAEIRN